LFEYIRPIHRRALIPKLWGDFVEEFRQVFDIQKIDEAKHLVYGKALVPGKFDSQQDIMRPEEIEKTAHNFLINLQKAYVELLSGKQVTKASEMGYSHKVFKGVGGFGYIAESYIDPEGSWVLVTKVTDPNIWRMIQNKEITGYSVGGKGRRIPVQVGDV